MRTAAASTLSGGAKDQSGLSNRSSSWRSEELFQKNFARLHDDLCTQFGSELSIDGQSVRMRDRSSAENLAKSVHIGSYIGHFLGPFLYASGSNLSLYMPPSSVTTWSSEPLQHGITSLHFFQCYINQSLQSRTVMPLISHLISPPFLFAVAKNSTSTRDSSKNVNSNT